MAQVIRIKRGGLANLVATTPTLVQGELLLATGSLNGLKSTFFVASASDSPSLPYAKIETITNGATLGASLDSNFEGLLIHSASDNKLYRYSGTQFVELPIAAGSFVGTLPVGNGGTGQSTLTDGGVLVGNGADPITSLAIGTAGQLLIGQTSADPSFTTISGIITINNTGVTSFTATANTAISGAFTATSASIATSIVNTSSSIATSIANIVNGTTEISLANNDTYSYANLLNKPAGIVSASVLSSPAQGQALLTTNGVGGSTIDLGLETTDSPQFAGLTLTGDLAVNGGDITSTAATFNFVTSNSTALNIGSGSATTTIKGATINLGNTTDNTGTTINLGNANNSATINVKGNLNVNGTVTTVDSTTVNIGDRIIELNAASAAGDGGIYVRDADGNQTGSLLWDVASNYWKGGLQGSEKALVRTETATGFTGIPLAFVYASSSNTLDHKSFTYAGVADDGYYLVYSASQFQATKIIDGGTF